MGTVYGAVYCSSPERPALRCPGPKASGPFGQSLFIENDSPQIHHFPRGLRPGAPPPLSFSLRRGMSGIAPLLDFSVRRARTRLGLILPISHTLRKAREKSLKSSCLFLNLLKHVESRKTLSLSLI